MLGRPEGTVKADLHHARAKLKAAVGEMAMSDPFDPIEDWLGANVELMPPAPGRFEVVHRRARRRKAAVATMTVAGRRGGDRGRGDGAATGFFAAARPRRRARQGRAVELVEGPFAGR